jgi:hypothetical protein
MTSLRSGDREDIDEVDLGILGEQLGADLRERPRDLACEVCVTRALALERVEDAVRRVLELERVPGDVPCSAVFSGFACRRASAPNVTVMSTPLCLWLTDGGEHVRPN